MKKTDLLEKRIAELEKELEEHKQVKNLYNLQSLVLDQICDRVTITNLDGVITYVNQAEMDTLGYDRKELIGKKTDKFGENSNLGTTQEEILKKTLEEGHWRGEVVNYDKNGTPLVMDCRTKMIYDKNKTPIALSGNSTDITHRKKIEQKLKENEQRFKNLLENLPISVYIHNKENGDVIYANHYALKEYDCKNLTELNTVGLFNAPPYTKEKALEKILLVEKEGPQKFEWYNEKKDGTGIWKEMNLQELILDDVPRILSVAYDITDRKNFEKLVIISERLNAIKDLSAGVSHDFNNALQIISGNLEIALMDDSTPSHIKDYLDVAIQSTQDTKSRIETLQRFADEKYQKPKPKLFNLKDVIDDTINQTERLWEKKATKNGINIDIKKSYDDNIPIFGSKSELNIALYDLLQNAIEAIEQDGYINISSKKKDDFVYLTLADTGVGMNEETQKKIFQPFYSTKSLKQGAGLGVTGAYSTIKNHNGEIYIKNSIVDKGTTLEIKLPLSKPQPNINETSQSYTDKLKVLWVDDEYMIRNLGQQMLSNLGHSADVAYDGENALKLLETNHYDLLLTDISMPKMDGWELTETIRDKYLTMKRVVLSGWNMDIDDKTKEKYNVNYVLNKPIQLKDIRNLVYDVIKSK